MIPFSRFWSLQYSAGGGPLTQLISQRLGAIGAWSAQWFRLSPSAVTLLGTASFALGCMAMATWPATSSAAIVCGLVFQIAYGLDCADGQLARATRRTSSHGAWLDIAMDFCRNLMLTASILVLCTKTTQLSFEVIVLGSFCFAIGTTLKLYTLTVIRQSDKARSQKLGYGSVRQFALLTTDTATILLLMAVLRLWPEALLIYVALIGITYSALAVAQAQKRLRD